MPLSDFCKEDSTPYLLEDQFNEFMNEVDSKTSLSFIHFNCRSLRKNYENIFDYITSLSVTFDVIGLTETWINQDEIFSLFVPPNYSYVNCGRVEGRGGGVGILIHNNLKYFHRSDLTVVNKQYEMIFIEIPRESDKNILIGAMYRPPNQSVGMFINDIYTVLSNLQKENKDCYLMGDYNIDLMKMDVCLYVNDFAELMASHCFFPIIYNPTRITKESATLIDNIFSNTVHEFLKIGILLTDITDHLPIFATLSWNKPVNSERVFYKRNITDSGFQLFNRNFSTLNFQNMYNTSDVDMKYNLFMNAFKNIYDSCFPLKKITIKERKSVKLWITNEI